MDSFLRDLHAFHWPPPEICQVEYNIIENLKDLEKNFGGPNSVEMVKDNGELGPFVFGFWYPRIHSRQHPHRERVCVCVCVCVCM